MIDLLDKKNNNYNCVNWEVSERIPLAVQIKDNSGEVVAGAAASSFGDWLLLVPLATYPATIFSSVFYAIFNGGEFNIEFVVLMSTVGAVPIALAAGAILFFLIYALAACRHWNQFKLVANY